MTDVLKPNTQAQIIDMVRWSASGNKQAMEIIGHGSKRGLGHVVDAENILDLSELSGITLYEPEELVMTAQAGTSVAEVTLALDAQNQRLAFEPWSPTSIFGTEGGTKGGTMGGIFAAAVAGPRRPLVGSARDHLLGFHGVNGRGEAFKSGGKVVKNVTGFDLSKLMAGSMGTLGILTEVSFKVMPKPEKSRTILVFGADDFGAAMRSAQNSPYEVSGVAHLPEAVAAKSAVAYVKDAKSSVTAVRVEGPGPSVEVRCKALREILSAYGDVEELHSKNTETLWVEIRDVTYFAGETPLWRISVPPTDGPALAVKLAENLGANLGGECYFDWAGGLMWLSHKTTNADQVRGLMTDGHATMMRGPKNIPAFHPQAKGVADLSERIRAGFDPHGIFNPGRL